MAIKISKNIVPLCLSIAGSDPCGGAGIQADLKVWQQLAVYGMAVPSLLTVQNTAGVIRVETLAAALVAEQLAALVEDVNFSAVKTGALGSAAVVEVVAQYAREFHCPLVVDPVLVASSGAVLLDAAAIEVLKAKLLPLAFLATPNAKEATLLSGIEVSNLSSASEAAKRIADYGVRNVLITGGHFSDDFATDVLLVDGQIELIYPSPEVAKRQANSSPQTDFHGTGCVLSAAIAAGLAQEKTLQVAVRRAKELIESAISSPQQIANVSGKPVLNLQN